jgi:hypothetical protein
MPTTEQRRTKLHRGFPDNPEQFARAFVEGRLSGFAKDMHICLRGIHKRANNRSVLTHAYFPALMSCCGMLEYMTGLYIGRINGLGRREVTAHAIKYLPQPDYNADVIRILFDAFRNALAHRGIASGVWIDRHHATRGRRLTWKVFANATRPPIDVRLDEDVLTIDSPWPCRITHRVHIRLGRLWRDIRKSANGYIADLVASHDLLDKFFDCMEELYPR